MYTRHIFPSQMREISEDVPKMCYAVFTSALKHVYSKPGTAEPGDWGGGGGG